jgi:hypothetical protein
MKLKEIFLHLLTYNENNSELKFNKEINSIEFVELIKDMDLSYCVDYAKRDLYLKNIGYKLFKFFKEKKYKKSKIQIKINHDIKYISKKASENHIRLFFKKLLNINIILNINVLKFQNYHNFSQTEVLSQDEIDRLLTPTDENDEEKIDNNYLINTTKVLSKKEIDRLLDTINENDEEE